ncbi:MAG: ribosome maturation factor RimP [Candidatus Tectimicrobiota bacterium]|nr:MAG: ribosome maturation factor RimP [Candidatus Tectomicrobia bacterium]
MYREALLQRITEVVAPLLEAQGVELVELQLQQRKGRWHLRIFVDIEGGVSLEDCRRLSLEIGRVLDVEDLMPTSYILEVSSPGLDRPLRTVRDFRRQQHRLVTLFLREPAAATYRGRVAAVTDTHVILHDPPEEPLAIPVSQIDHGVVELEFK